MHSSPRLLTSTIPVAFVVIVAGPNMPNPLLPLYGRTLDLDPANLSIIYSIFLVALVITLGVMSRPRMRTRPAATLALALAVAITADIVLATGTEVGLAVGRCLNGIGLGVGTGAAATLGLALRGERSRTLAATGTIIGAISGTLLSLILAEFGPAPLSGGYVIHGSFTFLVLIAIVVGTRLWPANRWALDRPPAESEVIDEISYPPRWTGFVTGTLAWMVGGTIIAVVPLAVSSGLNTTSLLLAGLGSISLLTFANIGQIVVNGHSVRRNAIIALSCLGLGLAVAALAVSLESIALVIVGCGIAGVGQGSGYRVGLRIVSAGLTPRRQGGRSSTYAAVAYTGCAVFVVFSGVAATLFGLVSGLWIVAAIIAPCAAFVIVVIGFTAVRSAQLRPSVAVSRAFHE